MKLHTRRALVFCAAGLTSLLFLPVALGMEAGELAGHTLTLDITETAVLNYSTDNRNTDLTRASTRVDDNWGEWRNRLTVQASWYRLIFGFRLDSSQFFHTPNPNELADEDVAARPPGSTPSDEEYRTQRTGQYGRELSNRYLNTLYPSKLYLSYASPEIDATVGDVYAQFGRGLVLSVRKIDELAVDTTIRGGKVTARVPMPRGTKLTLSTVGGYMNPMRVDEASGRVLQAPSAWYFAAMPQPTETPYVANPQATFVPDRLLGMSIEGGVPKATLGVHGVLLDRPQLCAFPDAPEMCTPFINQGIRGASQVRNFSGSLTLPDIFAHGSFYFEIAGQQQRNDEPPAGLAGAIPTSANDTEGHAVYSSFSAYGGPFTFTFEGKHYRKFHPLSANIDSASPSAQVSEFSLVQYSAPPTTLPVWVDTEANNFNVCVTGGRGRLDARVTNDLLVYGWVGRYATWGERGGVDCARSDETRNDVWDTAVGLEATFEKKRSHVFAWVGARDDQVAAYPEGTETPSDVYYREGYVRYDLLKHLFDTVSLQMQGATRRRHDDKAPLPWWEGEHYTAVQWAPHLSVAFGYEYLTLEGHPSNYYNGSIKWRIDPDKSVRLFYGQQRGALRCISGVCREFPPFEGAKAEAVVRF